MQRDCILPEEQVQWSDGCIIVYSITDRDSFNYALDTLENLQKIRAVSSIPITLLGNKADLEHLREVRYFYIVIKVIAKILEKNLIPNFFN